VPANRLNDFPFSLTTLLSIHHRFDSLFLSLPPSLSLSLSLSTVGVDNGSFDQAPLDAPDGTTSRDRKEAEVTSERQVAISYVTLFCRHAVKVTNDGSAEHLLTAYRKGVTRARAQPLGGGSGSGPPKFGWTTPTFLMKSVITVM